MRGRSHLGLILLIVASYAPAGPEPAAGQSAQERSSESAWYDSSAKGARIYAIYCAVCHGKRGQGGLVAQAPPLNEVGGISRLSKEELLSVIAEGRPGTLMKGWARRHGGKLTDAQIRLLVDFLRDGLVAKGV